MAQNPKAKAAAAAAAPYVTKLLSDEELRDNVRVALDSARQAFTRLQNGGAPSKTVMDDKKFKKNMADAASALKDAGDALRTVPKGGKVAAKRSGSTLGAKLALVAIAGVLALVLSEGLRGKVLDALFGKEEEFDYSSSGAANGSA